MLNGLLLAMIKGFFNGALLLGIAVAVVTIGISWPLNNDLVVALIYGLFAGLYCGLLGGVAGTIAGLVSHIRKRASEKRAN